MNRYWTRIALGVLLVFCLGMAGMAAVREGKREVTSLLTAAGTRIPRELTNLKFRLDGQILGDISTLEVNRRDANDVGSVRVRVTVDDLQNLEGLAGCLLALAEDAGHSKRFGFRCAEPAEIESGGYSKLGDVTFDPGGITRPLFFSEDEVSRWRHSDVASLNASMTKDAKGGVEASGNFDVRHDGRARKGSFSLITGENSTAFSVRDERGKALVEFRAGEQGVHLNIHDREGRSLLRLLADSLSASLKARHR